MPMSSIQTMLLLSQDRMKHRPRVGNVLPYLFLAVFALAFLGHVDSFSPVAAASSVEEHADEYKELLEVTEDKDGLESIRAIHEQLDDDRDGTIEPSETGDFIRVDLHPGNRQQQQDRQKSFHKKDSEITVKDLWSTWWKSDVHNWTVEHTVEWLIGSCELPQYAEKFRKHKVTGSKVPLIAVGGTFLSKVLGITNPIHRSKITLKAMDVVLFGPPKDPSSLLKDIVLTTLLVLAVTGFAYAYRQNKRSRQHLQQMISDMEALSQAEKTLQEMQTKLSKKDSEISSLHHQNNLVSSEVPDASEVSRLKEEVEVLRHELQRAEFEIEDKCWVSPPVLQHWLQLTYEIESAAYNAKRRNAEDQLEMAKDMCERLKKKRSSLVGAFVSTHGRSIDDVDRSILEAKTALLEVTKDLQERTARWRQIEMLCGCSIMNNAGIQVLQNLVRHVGVGRGPAGHLRLGGSSRMSGSMSQDDLLADDNMDAHSVAASSSHMTSMSLQLRERLSVLPSSAGERMYTGSSAVSVSGLSSASISKPKRHLPKPLSRESSKESSSSDEQSDKRPQQQPPYGGIHSSGTSVTGTPPLSAARKITPGRVGPNGRMMVKSYSQDASSNMAAMAASAAAVATSNPTTTASITNVSDLSQPSITSSVSETIIIADDAGASSTVTVVAPPQAAAAAASVETVLSTKPPLPKSASTSLSSLGTSSAETTIPSSPSTQSLRPPTVEEESQSDTSSLGSELEKKTKKKRSFFTFRRKKEKIP